MNVSIDGRSLAAQGLRLLMWGTVASVVFALLEGAVRGPFAYAYAHAEPGATTMFATWCFGLRNICENLMWAGALLFVAGKFLETRTTFSIGFDRLDAARVSMKGPDDDNTVWIGRRYGSRLEAESVAAGIQSRLEDDAAA